MSFIDDNDPDKIIFVYNGFQEIEASRKAVASSCIYFQCLLQGFFRESQEKRIHIQMEDFTFGAFETLIIYANKRDFDNRQQFRHYLEVIQLASVYLFDELVQIIELHLIEHISLEKIITLHTLANMINLPNLLRECLAFEKQLDAGGTLNKNWGRCPLPGHQDHPYHSCVLDRPGQEEDWDKEPDLPTARLSEEESIRLAEYRLGLGSYAISNNKRYFRMTCYK